MSALAVLLLFIVLTACLGTGRLLFRAVDHGTSAVEQGIFSTALGLAALSFTVLVFALLGVLYRWVFALGLLLILAFTFSDLRPFLSRLRREGVEVLQDINRGWVSRCLSGLLLFHLLFNFIACLAPPTEMDALVHHLAVPKVYVAHRGFVDMPSHIHSYLPHAVQMLFTLGLLLHGDVLAVLLHYGMGLLLVASIFALCRRWLNAQVGLLAAAVFYSLPMVTYVSTTPHVDFGIVLFSFLSVYAFLMWRERPQTEGGFWLMLSGVFAGAAMGVKFIALFNLGILSLFVLHHGVRTEGWRVGRLGRSLGRLWGPAILAASPWYVKTWILTGNPVFPIAYGVWGGKYWNPTVDAILSQNFSSSVYPLGRGLLDYVCSPWRFTMNGAAVNAGANGYGPIFLTFLPFLLAGQALRRPLIRYALAYAGIFYTLLFFSYQYGRWFLTLVPWLGIAVAYVIFQMASFSRFFRSVTVAAVSAILFFHLGVDVIYNEKFLPVVLGLEDRDEFLTGNTWYYKAYHYINRQLPPDSKILLWSWYAPYYLDRDYVIGLPTRQAFIDYERFASAREMLGRLKALGVTHVLWDKNVIPETLAYLDGSQGVRGGEAFMEHFYSLKDELMRRHLRPVYAYAEERVGHRTLHLTPYTVPIALYAIDYP